MKSLLPTGTFEAFAVTSLRDSLTEVLANDHSGTTLKLFFYAITESGWREVRTAVLKWKKEEKARTVTCYAGTDHAITDPEALRTMERDGVDVRMMSVYSGVFHPKLVWLSAPERSMVWLGSNNLTRDGLLHNIEFAGLIATRNPPTSLDQWSKQVALGSTKLNEEMLRSYEAERAKFVKTQVGARVSTFTWSRRTEPRRNSAPATRPGDLIIEIMPEETRGGNQVQIPKAAASSLFGIDSVGDSRTISLEGLGAGRRRQLVVTVFANNTVRLSINELEYGDRPCVIVFRRIRSGTFRFEIVPQGVFPSRYRALLALCVQQTRPGSRRWAIIS